MTHVGVYGPTATASNEIAGNSLPETLPGTVSNIDVQPNPRTRTDITGPGQPTKEMRIVQPESDAIPFAVVVTVAVAIGKR